MKLQYFGHLMQRNNSMEKTLTLGKTEGRRKEQQSMRWLCNWSGALRFNIYLNLNIFDKLIKFKSNDLIYGNIYQIYIK